MHDYLLKIIKDQNIRLLYSTLVIFKLTQNERDNKEILIFAFSIFSYYLHSEYANLEVLYRKENTALIKFNSQLDSLIPLLRRV